MLLGTRLANLSTEYTFCLSYYLDCKQPIRIRCLALELAFMESW